MYELVRCAFGSSVIRDLTQDMTLGDWCVGDTGKDVDVLHGLPDQHALQSMPAVQQHVQCWCRVGCDLVPQSRQPISFQI